MRILKAVMIAGTALALSGPAFGGRTQDQIVQHERAVQKMRAHHHEGLAGPVGEQGRIGPGAKSTAPTWNVGHPTERVRR